MSRGGFSMLKEVALTQEEYLTIKEVASLIGVSRNTLYCWQRDRDFPKALRVGLKAIRFRRSEILGWLESRPRATAEVGPEAARKH